MNNFKIDLSSVRLTEDRLLVKVDAEKTMTDEGIHIPEQARQFTNVYSGTISRVGPGRREALLPNEPISDRRLPMTAKPNDRIVFSRHGGYVIENIDDPDNAEYLILTESEIIMYI